MSKTVKIVTTPPWGNAVGQAPGSIVKLPEAEADKLIAVGYAVDPLAEKPIAPPPPPPRYESPRKKRQKEFSPPSLEPVDEPDETPETEELGG